MKGNEQAIKAALQQAQDYCDEEDKSTEFMIQYMADTLCGQFGFEFYEAHDRVMEFLINDQ